MEEETIRLALFGRSLADVMAAMAVAMVAVAATHV